MKLGKTDKAILETVTNEGRVGVESHQRLRWNSVRKLVRAGILRQTHHETYSVIRRTRMGGKVEHYAFARATFA